MTHSRNASFRGRSQRRLTAWSPGPGGTDLASMRTNIAASGTFILGTGVVPTTSALTIIRIRGHVSTRMTAATAAGDGFNLVFGIGIVTEDAFADIGVTALPDPFEDTSWPGWMWLGNLSMHTAVGGLAIGDPTVNPVQMEIDTKAMRKWRQNEVIFCSVQAGENITAVVDIEMHSRMLLKLS